MRFLVSVGVTLLAAAGLFGFGWAMGADRARATQEAQEAAIRRAADEVDARVAERIAAIRIVRQTINGQVREVIRENTVYRDCVVDEPMRRLLDAARSGGSFEPAPDRGGLP